MKLHSVLRLAGLLAAAACLTLAYGMVGDWLILLSIPVMIIFWFLARGRSGFRAASGLLAMYVGLGVIGIARHASGPLMATGCVFALLSWDLSDPRGRSSVQARPGQATLLEKRHLQSLGVAAGVSLLLAALTSALRLTLPFGVVVLLALVLTACILYAVQYLRRSAGHEHRE